MDQEGWNRETTCYPTAACFEADPVPTVAAAAGYIRLKFSQNIMVDSTTFEGVVGKGLRVQVAASGLAKVSSFQVHSAVCADVYKCARIQHALTIAKLPGSDLTTI